MDKNNIGNSAENADNTENIQITDNTENIENTIQIQDNPNIEMKIKIRSLDNEFLVDICSQNKVEELKNRIESVIFLIYTNIY